MPIRPGPVSLIEKGKYYVPIRTIHMDKNYGGKIAFKKNRVYLSKAEGWLASELVEQHGCYDEFFCRLFREYVPEPHDRVHIVPGRKICVPSKEANLFIIDMLSIKNKSARLMPANHYGTRIWWPVDKLEVVLGKAKPERRVKQDYEKAPWTR